MWPPTTKDTNACAECAVQQSVETDMAEDIITPGEQHVGLCEQKAKKKKKHRERMELARPSNFSRKRDE